MRIVNVTNLETGTITAQTARTKGRHTTLMRDFSQRVLLIHELAQRVGSEITIDDRRDRLRVNQVGRSEDFVVTNIHSLTHGAGHTSQTNTELVEQLLTYRTNTTVGQVVDIIHLGVGVNQHDEVLDDLNDILLGQDASVLRNGHIELTVDTITSYITEVITFLREEEVLNHLTRRCIICRLCVSQLTIDIENSLFLRLGRVFLQGVEDDSEIILTLLLLVEKNGLGTRFQNCLQRLRSQLFLALYNDGVTLDRRYFTGIFIHEILYPCSHHISGQFTTDTCLQRLAVHLHLFCQIEAVEDVTIGLETDGAEQCGNRQFLLTVDVSIHDLVDIRSELDPRTAERDNTRRIELGSVRVHRCAEEYTRRAVQLTNDNALSTIDDKGAFRRHVRNSTQINIGNDGVEILMIGILATKTQFRFQRHTVGQTALDTLFDSVTRTINRIIQECQRKTVASILNREVFREYPKESLSTTLFRSGIHLNKIGEGLQLNLQKVRIRHMLLHTTEIDSLLFFCCSHYFDG